MWMHCIFILFSSIFKKSPWGTWVFLSLLKLYAVGYNFFSVWRTSFSYSVRVVLLMTNYFSFVWDCYFPSFPKYIVTRHRIYGWQFFPFNAWKMGHFSGLHGSRRKHPVILTTLPLRACAASVCFRDIFLCQVEFSEVWWSCVWHRFLWVYLVWDLLRF